MKVSLLQYDIAWCSAEQNAKIVDNLVERVGETDLLLLPEMWSTGFVMNPDGVAEADGGRSLEWMRLTAARLDAAVAGSVAIRENDEYRNRFYFVRPDGSYDFYDKHHLFSYGGENRCYTPGQERRVVEWRGVRFLLLVCYDLRFPVFARCRDDYDAILLCANWPVSRQHSWEVLLQARAMENQSYVLASNRIGSDDMCEYQGGTMIVNPYGDILQRCPDQMEAVVSMELDMEMLAAFRAKFPVLQDSDSFICCGLSGRE